MLTWASIDAAMQAAPGAGKEWSTLAGLARSGASAPDDLPCQVWGNLKAQYAANLAFIAQVIL